MNGAPLHSVSVAGVALNEDGQVLLIRRRDNGEWQAPGGILELNETFEQGVVREIFEETGVEVAVEALTGVYKNLTRGVVALVFRCHPTGGHPTVTSESRETAWLPPHEAISLMTPVFAVRVRDAVNFGLSQVAQVRAHDGIRILS